MNTILAQLGGNKFAVMTGAKQFVADGTRVLQFGIGRGACNGVNKVRVTLTADDLYEMAFYSVRGVKVREVITYPAVYADRIADVFSEATGFDTRLPVILRRQAA